MYDSNYENDHRVRAINKWYDSFDERQMVLYVTLYDDDDGEEIEFEANFPAKWDVCDTCQGKGSHVNPSVDCHGLSREDFYEDPDFAEDYHRGVYDQTCNGCGGRTTVPLIDEDRMNDEQRKWLEMLHQKWKDDAAYEAECAAERRMGA